MLNKLFCLISFVCFAGGFTSSATEMHSKEGAELNAIDEDNCIDKDFNHECAKQCVEIYKPSRSSFVDYEALSRIGQGEISQRGLNEEVKAFDRKVFELYENKYREQPREMNSLLFSTFVYREIARGGIAAPIINCYEEITVTEISKLKEIHEILKFPTEDKLSWIHPYDFSLYIDVDGDTDTLKNLVKNYTPQKAQTVLYWLINNEEVFKVFENEDDRFDVSRALVERIGGYSIHSSNIHFPFVHRTMGAVDGSEDKKLIEIIIESGDDDVMEWFLDFIEDHNQACDENSESKYCFQVYCKMGSYLGKDMRAKWLYFEDFEDYLDDIIEDQTNAKNAHYDSSNRGNGWIYGSGDGQLESAYDLSDDWVSDLCWGLY